MVKLSNSESIIMKAIWRADHRLSVSELMDVLEIQYGKAYKRTSIATFLLKLETKGFAKSERDGRLAYVVPLVSEQEDLSFLAGSELDFWYKGDVSLYLSALCDNTKVSEEKKKRIKKLLELIKESENGN